jgi:hypothetical protein
LVFALCRFEKVVDTRASSWPARSIATMVLSKVGAFGCWRSRRLPQLLAHAGFEGRLEVLVLDLVEGRIVERQRTGYATACRHVPIS